MYFLQAQFAEVFCRSILRKYFAEVFCRVVLGGFGDLLAEIRGQLRVAAGDFFCVFLAFVGVSVAKERGERSGSPFLRDGDFLSHVHQSGVLNAARASGEGL